MRAALFFFILLLAPPAAPGQGAQSGTYAFEARRGRHTAKVVFTVRPFDPSRHRIVMDVARHYEVVWVLRPDGRHSRFAGDCADCGFLDFRSGFFRHDSK